jgi:predicted transcriptional regulator
LRLRELIDILDAEVIVGAELLDNEFETATASDLISDVLAYALPGCLLITGLTNPQVIRTADVLDITAIILGRGKKFSADTIYLAKELNIPVFTTKFILFEIVGRLYEHGIRGCIQKVGDK